MTTLAACTIVSKNYIAFARVLARSFLENHPGGRFFVLLVDRNEGRIDPAQEAFTLLQAEDLDNIPDLPSFLFKYTLLECNTAVKPYLLEYLFERLDLPNLVYFDPDIRIFRPLDELAELVDRHQVVLTPHLTSPIDDDAHPGELAILQAGTYNLGFVALRRTPGTGRLLRWWQERLYDRCVVRIEDGLFVDQKWMDLAPGLFEGVHVLTDPGYNVAYWNLHGRKVTLADDGPRSNDRPLVFFHFSGIRPESLDGVSKHQDRFTLAEIGEAADLYRAYRDEILEAGWEESKSWPYAFARFDNGVRIPEDARRVYLDLGPRRRRRFGNPFEAASPRSYFAWLNEPSAGAAGGSSRAGDGPYMTRWLYRLYSARPDLRRAFPDVEGKDFPEFCSWLADFGRHEMGLDDAFLATLHRETKATRWTPSGLKRRLKNRLKRAYHSPAGKAVRGWIKGVLGHRRYGELRRRVRPAAETPGIPLGKTSGTEMPARRRPALAPPCHLERPGINLVGYLRAETGMGEAARGLARALGTTDIPTTLHHLDLNVLARQDESVELPEDDYRHDVNLFVVNADQVSPVFEHLGGEVFAGRYNVGFWLWELERFPRRWSAAFDLLHEIWTPSTFCADAISAISPIPVRRVPLPVGTEPPATAEYDRAHFGLAEDSFVFFFMFNYLSFFERKNPLAVVDAFRRAFGEGDDAVLVLKTSQSDFAPEERDRITAAIGNARIRLVDEYWSRGEITALTGLADAYVSLHRSEGYGLTLAEAMALGKPVIATDYSGNTDFTTLKNSYPVRYDLVELSRDAGPYPAGASWAEPDVDHAAELMRRVFERRDEAHLRGRRARRDLAARLSFEEIGAILRQRFQLIAAGSRNPLCQHTASMY